MGTNVGTKNHSRMFVPELRKTMHAVMIEIFEVVLTEEDPATGMPRPFGFMADKMTLGGRSGQMNGVITMIEGVLTAFFLGVQKVRSCLTTRWLIPSLPQRCSAHTHGLMTVATPGWH